MRGVLTVGILADLPKDRGGGVNQFTQALIAALLERRQRDIRYVVFLADDEVEAAEPSACLSTVRVRRTPFPKGGRKWMDRLVRYSEALGQAALGHSLQARVTVAGRSRQRSIRDAIRRSPWKLDVVHFPFQDSVPVDAPSIFCPWDLQHLHVNEAWARRQANTRDAYYRLACRRADMVVLASEWAREDVIAQYGVPRTRTAVIRVAPPTRMAPAATAALCLHVREKFELPHRFMFYPGAMWKHKNHLRLITALAKVGQSSQPDLHLVCCGRYRTAHLEEVMAHATHVGIESHVRFLGHVDTREVRALYHLAEFCIYPSLFEGAGLPVLEAFEEGCPLAASDVTCIPEYAGDAALLFNPRDVNRMAAAIALMSSSPHLRRRLTEEGKVRVRNYSWENVAAEYIVLYQRLADPMGVADRAMSS